MKLEVTCPKHTETITVESTRMDAEQLFEIAALKLLASRCDSSCVFTVETPSTDFDDENTVETEE